MAFRQAEPPQSALVLQSGMWVQLQRQKPWKTVVDCMNSGCTGAVAAGALQTACVAGARRSRLGAQPACGAAGAGAAKAAAVMRTRAANVKRIVLHISIFLSSGRGLSASSYNQGCPAPDGPGRPVYNPLP